MNCAQMWISQNLFLYFRLWSLWLKGRKGTFKIRKLAESRTAPCFLPASPESSLHSSVRWLATLSPATGSVRGGHRRSAHRRIHTHAHWPDRQKRSDLLPDIMMSSLCQLLAACFFFLCGPVQQSGCPPHPSHPRPTPVFTFTFKIEVFNWD